MDTVFMAISVSLSMRSLLRTTFVLVWKYEKRFFIVSHVFDLKQIPSFACFPLVAAQHNLL